LPPPATRKRRRRASADPNGPAEAIDYGPLDEWVGFHLRLAQNASFQSFARLTGGLAVRPGRFATLLLIGRNPGISQTALSRANARDKSSLTPVLKDLVQRGLVRRRRAPGDRRSYRLTLTPAGGRLLKKLEGCAREHDGNLDRVIGKDRAKFLAVLRRITAAMG
jgi:DNA-binding MarR family transcriptional regulator